MKRFLTVALTSLVGLAAGAAAAASITFYQDDNYRGAHVTADRAMGNFSGSGFNDGARSAVVHDGRWEICVDADFRGSCGVLAPGAYPDLGAYAGRISSVRPIDGNYSGRNDERGRDRDRGPVARATLYEGANLSGRSYQLRDTMRDMQGTGINDRASSLRVETGYWIFCSDCRFPRRMPHLRARRIRVAARHERPHLVGPHDLQRLPVRGQARLAARRLESPVLEPSEQCELASPRPASPCRGPRCVQCTPRTKSPP